MLRIGVLVSGGGTNLQAILDAINSGEIPGAQVAIVISNNSEAYALKRASQAGIITKVISPKAYSGSQEFDQALSAEMTTHKIDLILLAGFMAILGPDFFTNYENRVMNIHPALIPAFSGPGFYGLKVHKAVIAYGCKVSGASVHFVTPEVDAGPLILQETLNIHQDDTPEVLQRRIMEEIEWKIYPRAVRLFAEGRLEVFGRKVRILEREESGQLGPIMKSSMGDG